MRRKIGPTLASSPIHRNHKREKYLDKRECYLEIGFDKITGFGIKCLNTPGFTGPGEANDVAIPNYGDAE
ncbi:MAG TPA: hypothetical protein VIK28_11440 [Sedimentisphaerales bacterium]